MKRREFLSTLSMTVAAKTLAVPNGGVASGAIRRREDLTAATNSSRLPPYLLTN